MAARRARASRPNSLAAYRRDLRRYADYLRRRGRHRRRRDVDEAIVAGYVEELQQARDDDGRRALQPSSIARALAAVRSFHRFCVEEGLLASDPSEDVGAPRVPAGDPEGAHRGRGRGAARRGAGRRPAPATRPGDPRDCSTRAGCASASSSGLDLGDLDLHDGLVRVLGQGQQGTGRAARAHRARRARRLPHHAVAPSWRGRERARRPRCSSTRGAAGSPARARG